MINILIKRNSFSDEVEGLLCTAYARFSAQFEQLLQRYLLSSGGLDELVRSTRDQLSGGNWEIISGSLPESLASVFAVWTIMHSKSFNLNLKSHNSVIRPHPIQVHFKIPTLHFPQYYLHFLLDIFSVSIVGH